MINLEELILDRYDEIENDMKEIIAIESVSQKCNDEQKPLGEGVAKALDWTANKLKSWGIKYKVIENKVIYAEYGSGEQYDAVLAHFDIVPVGTGWKTDPLTLTKIDGIYYARGIADDKGFGVVALHCLKLFSDLAIKGNRRLRVIIGFDEECNMEDMKAYLKEESLPQNAFTPDVEYTVCNREKGILQLSVSSQNTSDIEINGGTVTNAVASGCKVSLKYNHFLFCELEKNKNLTIAQTIVEKQDDEIIIYSKGVASHAMEPEKGINAITSTVELLKMCNFEFCNNLLKFVSEKIGLEYNGKMLGVATSDEPSGELTLNLGKMISENGTTKATIDIRYPVTKNGCEIIEKIESVAKEYGVKVNVETHKEPLYLEESHPFIKLLCDSFEEVTGQKAIVYSTGGGTYARSLKGRAVGFGGAFLSSPPTKIHTNEENISVEDMKKHCQICARAMYKMIMR